MTTENQLEQECLGWFREDGWETAFGPDIAHDGAASERVTLNFGLRIGDCGLALPR